VRETDAHAAVQDTQITGWRKRAEIREELEISLQQKKRIEGDIPTRGRKTEANTVRGFDGRKGGTSVRRVLKERTGTRSASLGVPESFPSYVVKRKK